MQAIQLSKLVSGPDDLEVVDLKELQPEGDKYLIRIRAAAINFFDNLQIQGKHQQKPPLPFIAGNEFAGEVLAVPSKRKSPKFRVGDRVFGAGLGAFATQILSVEEDLRPVPEGWTYRDAASLFYTAPTAYAALILRAQAKKGDYVLVHGAAGGVGIAAVAIASALGMHVIASADTAEKREIAKRYGASHVVDATKDWEKQAKDLTPNGRGVDVVIDPLGVINPSLKCIRWDGRLVVVGFAAGNIEQLASNRLLLKNVSVSGLFWGMYATMDPESVVQVWDALLALIGEGKIRPWVYSERRFQGLEQIPTALKLLSTGKAWGKIVVDVKDAAGSKL